MRKNKIWIITVITLILVISVLSACNTKKPWEYSNVEWYSETTIIQIIKSSDKYWEGTLEVDGEVKPVKLLWGPTCSFEIIDATKDDGNTAVEEMTFLSGRVEYDKSSATLVIKDDNVFDNKYDKIKLLRKDL